MADGDDEIDIELNDLAAGEDEQPHEDHGEPEGEADASDDGGETVIAFADESEEEADDTPLVKRLRQQLREEQRRNAQLRKAPANDDDPEPQIPAIPDIEAFDYDKDRFDAAVKEREAAVLAHAEWKARDQKRKDERQRVADEQSRQIEQQRKSLGVSDYEERSALVKDRLSEAQLAILVNGASNPARLIYALGRSPSKLDQLAGEDNLARFAVTIGSLERDIKVTKRSAPSVDTPVRGATATSALAGNAEKELKRLEKEAARTGDRTALIRFKKQMASKAA